MRTKMEVRGEFRALMWRMVALTDEMEDLDMAAGGIMGDLVIVVVKVLDVLSRCERIEGDGHVRD